MTNIFSKRLCWLIYVLACSSDLLSHLCETWRMLALLVSSIRIVWSAKESQPGPHVTLWNAISEKIFWAGRDTRCSTLLNATELSGPPVGAVLTLPDDNNGAGNDNGIERNRYHCKEVVWRWNFSLSKLLDRSYFNLESSWLLIIWKPKHTKAWHPVTCWDTTWSPDCLIARSKSMQIFYFFRYNISQWQQSDCLIAWSQSMQLISHCLTFFYFTSVPRFLGKLIENGLFSIFAGPPSLHATVFLVVSCYAPGAPPTIHTETPRDTFTTHAYAYHFSFVICRENLFLPSKYVWGKCILSKYASM